MPKKPSKPHDEFFKATFSRVKVAREYLQKMLSPALLQVLDLKQPQGLYFCNACIFFKKLGTCQRES